MKESKVTSYGHKLIIICTSLIKTWVSRYIDSSNILHISENQKWFDGVEVTCPLSILSKDLKAKHVS